MTFDNKIDIANLIVQAFIGIVTFVTLLVALSQSNQSKKNREDDIKRYQSSRISAWSEERRNRTDQPEDNRFVWHINLRIPKLRAGSFFPEGLIERYPGVDRAVAAAVSEMVTNGVSASKVKRVAQSMGIDRMSASQVSRMCSSLDDTVADLQERDPSDVRYPYIWLDATQQSSYPSTRRTGRCRRCARR